MNASYDEQLEQRIAEFEGQWQSSPPADIRTQLTRLRNDDSSLRELLAVDLEYRWRSKRGSLNDELGAQPRIEDYVRFAKSCDCELTVSPEWISEEYRVRQIWGDQPSIEHFLGRFSTQADLLKQLLTRVNVELDRETIRPTKAELEFDQRAPLRYQDFNILELIGSGVSGKVYRAKQLSLDRIVAMKTLHKSLQLDDWAIDAFLNEGKILAGLDHAGIARVFGMGRFPGGGYFQVQEFVDGPNLREWLGSRNSIDQTELIHIVKSVAASLAFAHLHSVVHCDIKPENILISPKRIVIADFGMAMLVNHNAGSLANRSIGGTAKYMAPESSSKSPTMAVDVYAIGKIWTELNSCSSSIEPDEWTAFRERCQSTDPNQRPSAADFSQI